MPPALRPPTTSRRPGLLARALLATAAFLLPLSGLFATSSPAGATSAPSTIALVSQTPIVTTSAGMQVTVDVSSLLPAKDLGLEVTLYNQATERGYFEETVHGNLAGFVAVDQGPVIPLSTKGLLSSSGQAVIHLPVSAPNLSGPTPRTPRDGALLTIPCGAQCPGVYPLQISLEDTKDALPLASFITYLILSPTSVSAPLHFSLVLPIGLSPAYDSAGLPSVPVSDEDELNQLAATFSRTLSVACSLVVSPQLVGALEEAAGRPPDAKAAAARRALSSLRRLASLPNVEIEADTYAPVDVAALTAAHMSGELGPELRTGERVLRRLGATIDPHRYVSAWPIGLGALRALSRQGVSQLVLPSSSVASFPPSRWEYPVWAPFVVRHGRQVVADASDASLESHLESASNPVLRANQLLADLALLYFVEQPPEPRGVSLLAPVGWRPSDRFFSALIGGLRQSPLVTTDSLSQFFSEVPPGSAEQPLRTRALAAPDIAPQDRFARGHVATARIKLAALQGLLPPSSPLMTSLGERVLLGESAGLSAKRRAAYLNAPARALRKVAHRITLPVGKTITITSLSAKVPISIYSAFHYPLKVALSLDSTYLNFRHHDLLVTLHPKNNTREIALSARTAGDFPFELTVRTRSGGFLLARGKVLIRSTAISGVAVGLTAGAGVFLLAWWGRSVLKKRRGRHARGRTGAPTVSSAGAS